LKGCAGCGFGNLRSFGGEGQFENWAAFPPAERVEMAFGKFGDFGNLQGFVGENRFEN
jgi:hypothetical protein